MSETFAPDSWRLIPVTFGLIGSYRQIRRFVTHRSTEMLEVEGLPDDVYVNVAHCSLTMLRTAQYGPLATFDRPWAYVCSPYAPRWEESVARHVHWAQTIARLAYSEGFWPVVPHLYAPQFLDDTNPQDRQVGTTWGLALLRRCVMVYVLDVPPSSGMRQELAAITPAQCIRPVRADELTTLLRRQDVPHDESEVEASWLSK